MPEECIQAYETLEQIIQRRQDFIRGRSLTRWEKLYQKLTYIDWPFSLWQVAFLIWLGVWLSLNALALYLQVNQPI